MALEIERKFLIEDDSFKTLSTKQIEISQGYLSQDKERTVRVRIAGERAFITVKGENKGATRLEFEYEIPLDDARAMMSLCLPGVIEKTRYIVPREELKWEVDVFHGALEGLILAEVELPHEHFKVDLPDFIGAEVTGDPRYYNSNLVKTTAQCKNYFTSHYSLP